VFTDLGMVSLKDHIYASGVILLELISGKNVTAKSFPEDGLGPTSLFKIRGTKTTQQVQVMTPVQWPCSRTDNPTTTSMSTIF
jgi:hypothetical protein